MTLFTMLNGEKILIEPEKKIIPSQDFETLLEAKQIVDKVKTDEIAYKEKISKEAETLGFETGLAKFNEQLVALEEERKKVRLEMEHSLVPLAMAAVKKIIGRELELKGDTIVDIIATALKGISHHHKIKIFINKSDLEYVEAQKNRLKSIFDHLQTLTIAVREDIPEKECIIETEAGILHVGLENQIKAMEKAFQALLKENGK